VSVDINELIMNVVNRGIQINTMMEGALVVEVGELNGYCMTSLPPSLPPSFSFSIPPSLPLFFPPSLLLGEERGQVGGAGQRRRGEKDSATALATLR